MGVLCPFNTRKANGAEMKKIVSLILVLVCALSLFACSNASDAFVEVVNNSEPTKITTQTFVTSGSDTLQGWFESTINENGTTLTYNYQDYAPVTPDGTDRIATHTGTIYCVDGRYSWNATKINITRMPMIRFMAAPAQVTMILCHTGFR